MKFSICCVTAASSTSKQETDMIKPHGSDELNPLFVYNTEQRHALVEEAEGLPSILLNSAAAANAVMMGGGYFNPLAGYMNLADALSVAEKMHTVDGLFFPVPVVNMTDEAVEAGSRIALRDPNVEGNPVLAIMDVEAVEAVSDEQIEFMAERIFRTLDENHPGVATQAGPQCHLGPHPGAELLLLPDRFPGYLPHCGGNPQRDC
jgi:sulfate adenylyltransferase